MLCWNYKVAYEAFDAERYTITENNGSPVELNSGMFTLNANGDSITFSGLPNNNPVTVNVTLRKRSVPIKQKILPDLIPFGC